MEQFKLKGTPDELEYAQQ